MLGYFLQISADSLAQTAVDTSSAIAENIPQPAEMSAADFLLKGGVFIIPIALLLFYTLFVIVERYLFIQKRTQTDAEVLKEVRTHLVTGKIDLALATAERGSTASGRVIKEGILTLGRPISEIESNMERAANIEMGEMEKRLGSLGLIAGIAPTLGFIGTISGVIKIFYSISLSEDISIGNISSGLYEKMISSGAGLIVGIIAYAGYHLYNSKIDSFSLAVQKQILEFVTIIQRPGK